MPSDTLSKNINQANSNGKSSGTGCRDGNRASAFPPEGHLYLNSNNSDETTLNESKLSPYHRKQKHIIELNAEKLIDTFGIDNTGFFTITFPKSISGDNKEISRRFNNFNRRVLSKYFGDWGWQKERQGKTGTNGGWHYHILIDCGGDIRTGMDWDSYRLDAEIRKNAYLLGKKYKDIKHLVDPLQRNYVKSASPLLRELWKIISPKNVKKYGLGRCEIMPIKTNTEAASKYLGKYVSKHLDGRHEEDKGVRLSGYSKGFGKSSTKIAWVSPGGKLWRENKSILANHLNCRNQDELTAKLGKNFDFLFQELIVNIREYSKDVVLLFLKNHIPRTKFKDPVAGHLKVCLESGLLTDKLTGEVLF